jgi:broad specificity phosphatase PhoE
MGWPKLLVLVRHAESEGNVKTATERTEIVTPSHAYKLTKRGEEQAKITGEYLKKEFGKFDIYYVSYYVRSKMTMRIMVSGIKVREDPRLAEAQRGIWDRITEEEMGFRFPEELERKKCDGLYHYRPLGGENWPDIELRIHSFLGTLNRDCEDKKVLIVVHGQWLIAFQRLIHHFSIREAMRRRKSGVVENASVTIYKGVAKNGKSRMVLVNGNIVPWKGKL